MTKAHPHTGSVQRTSEMMDRVVARMGMGPRFMENTTPKRTRDHREKVRTLHAMTKPGEMLPPEGVRLLQELARPKLVESK